MRFHIDETVLEIESLRNPVFPVNFQFNSCKAQSAHIGYAFGHQPIRNTLSVVPRKNTDAGDERGITVRSIAVGSNKTHQTILVPGFKSLRFIGDLLGVDSNINAGSEWGDEARIAT
jgi:hypothetical protein